MNARTQTCGSCRWFKPANSSHGTAKADAPYSLGVCLWAKKAKLRPFWLETREWVSSETDGLDCPTYQEGD
jgi:hypothetical protein